MLSNYISLRTGAVAVSVEKDPFSNGNDEYNIVFDGDNFHICIAVKGDFLRKINNVLRNVCYPREKERVKVCLNATASKSALDNMQSGGVTSAATMASFLKSLRVEDVVFAGTSHCSENISQQTANCQEPGILTPV